LDISPEDADRLGIEHGDMVRVTSRRGTVDAPAYIDRSLRGGVVFMTLHFPDEIATNFLTINATDPRSGTAEFKACAVRVEPARKVSPRGMHRAAPLAARGLDQEEATAPNHLQRQATTNGSPRAACRTDRRRTCRRGCIPGSAPVAVARR